MGWGEEVGNPLPISLHHNSDSQAEGGTQGQLVPFLCRTLMVQAEGRGGTQAVSSAMYWHLPKGRSYACPGVAHELTVVTALGSSSLEHKRRKLQRGLIRELRST